MKKSKSEKNKYFDDQHRRGLAAYQSSVSRMPVRVAVYGAILHPCLEIIAQVYKRYQQISMHTLGRGLYLIIRRLEGHYC